MWIYFLIVISAIILLFVIPHFIVSYLLFRRYFARRSDEEIKNYFFNSSYYDSVRGTMLESLNRLNELDCRVLEITSFYNISIRGYYYPNNSKKTIILAHGHHADPRCIFAYTAERFYKEGFNVLIIAQRAHSISGGKYSSLGLFESKDILSWVEYVNKELGCKDIFVYGMSMGGTSLAIASSKLDKNIVKGIVLDCPYPSLNKLINQLGTSLHVPQFLFIKTLEMYVKAYIKIRFKDVDSKESLANNNIPTLFIGGKNDNISIESFIQEMYNTCACNKEIYIVDNAPHAIDLILGGNAAFDKLLAFVNEQET